MVPTQTQKGSITIDQLMRRLPAAASRAAKQQVFRAHTFSEQAHRDRRRLSGELYVAHDLAVADIVNQIGIDLSSTSAGMLHDTLLEHTGKSSEQLQQAFGDEVANLVTGLAKLDPFVERSIEKDDHRVELIRRAILTILDDDLRIVLIRMADALQDLRTAADLPVDIQQRVAEEARSIYAPLANRLGIWQIKWQLEDLAFRFLEPEEYQEISHYLQEKRIERDESIQEAIQQLRVEIEKLGLKARVTGRPKHIYSIHRKMSDKNLNFNDIYDVRAVRVIVESDDLGHCYQVLGIVHNLWLPMPHEFDDYIARPKANGYQSLHTTVVDDQGRTLEVQIRTSSMHEEAERGIAAHWAYKEGGRYSQQLNKRIQLLRSLLSPPDALGDPEDSDAVTSLEELNDRIYVFTPDGDPVDLPNGATPIDFAYHIHTQVGHRCRGAKVNGKIVKLDHKLKNGDHVEIITSKRGRPSRDWLNESLGYAASARTRSRVRRWFRLQERDQNILQGREVVERELRRLGLTETISIEDIAVALRHSDVEDFLAKVGFGDIQVSQISGAVSAIYQKLQPDDDLRPLIAPARKPKGLTVRGVSGLHTRFAQCCNPVPPEAIIGYITRGRGITVHRRDCSTVMSITEAERLIDVDWGYEDETYPIPIVIEGYNRPGLMNDITNILKGRGINLTSTKAITAQSVATIYLIAEVANLGELDWLLRKLEKLPNVVDVRRQRW